MTTQQPDRSRSLEAFAAQYRNQIEEHADSDRPASWLTAAVLDRTADAGDGGGHDV